MTKRKALTLLGVVATLALPPGCGDSTGLPPRYSVSGSVTYNDKPVVGGTIKFDPSDGKGRAAGGTIRDGRYSLTTLEPDDGALPGRYRVSIVARETDLSKVDPNARKRAGGPKTENDKKAFAVMYPQKIAALASAKARSLIPAKYNTPANSGLTFEVKEQSNTADFPLTD